MNEAQIQRAIQGLWKACEQDYVPDAPDTVAAFLFDRCTEWNKLLGLWQGVVKCMVGLPQEGDEEESWDKIKARVLREEAALKARLKAAVQQGRVVQFLEDVYEEFFEATGSSSGYYQWLQSQQQQLQERSTPAPLEPGATVRIHGLKGAKDLNSAFGCIAKPPADAPPGALTDRLPIKLRSPASVVAARPGGVSVRPANLQALPRGASAAVLTYDFCFWDAYAFDFGGAGAGRRAQRGELPEGWLPC